MSSSAIMPIKDKIGTHKRGVRFCEYVKIKIMCK